MICRQPTIRILVQATLVFITLFLFIKKDVHAQVTQTHRYERKQKMSDEFFTVISLNEQGIALIREKNKYEEGKQKWDVILLDTALNETFAFDILIKDRFRIIGYEYAKDHLYLLYRAGETDRSGLELLDINLIEGREAERFEIKPELEFRITHFNKVGGTMVLGGNVGNEPAVLLYNLTDKQIKVVPGFFQKESELVELRINQNQTFNVVLIDRSTRNARKMVFRTFDETGKLLLEDIVPIGDDRTLQAAISTSLIRDELMVLGTWGERQGKHSSGFFSVAIDPFSDQKINYFSFGQLNHFTDYMNQKRAQRIKENAREAADDNRVPAYTVNTMPFRVDEVKNGFFLLAEIYHSSNTGNNFGNNPYGPYNSMNPYYTPFWPGYYPGMRMYRPYTYPGNGRTTQDEIRTEASVLVAFDATGQVKWDYSFKADDVKRLSLEQVSDYYYDGATTYFFYKHESEIRYKVIDENEGFVKEGVEKVMLKFPEDDVRSDRDFEDGIKHWVGNSFYVWGYQTVRNPTQTEDRVRDVFFITKLVVE